MWIDNQPVDRQWAGGPVEVIESIYSFGEPVIFRTRIGFNDFLIVKKDEFGGQEFFLAIETNDQVVGALVEGRLSLRGAMNGKEAWLLDMRIPEVNAFQYIPEESLEDFLPARNVGLYKKFGKVPDTLEQADAFISFRFLGPELKKGSVPLAVLQAKINQFSQFVRRALTPPSLLNGRDSRFFDLKMAEPRFTSLVLSAIKPEIDEAGINRSIRLGNIDPDLLIDEATARGVEFWASLELVTHHAAGGADLSDDLIDNESEFLEALEGLVPGRDSGINRIEITFNDGAGLRTALIDQNVGEKILEAQARLKELDVRTINGVITEVNGDSGTFIIKDLMERQTTCDMPRRSFDVLDGAGQLERGRVVSITGEFTKRARRDRIWTELPITFLN